jgi:hypothetical protein
VKAILIGMVSVALMLGAAAAQDGSPTPSSSSPDSSAPVTSPAQPTTQQAPANAAPAPQTGASGRMRVAPGSVIPVALTKTLDAKKAKTGDEVTANVTADLKTDSGEILVPKDTKVVGHITEAQAHSKERKESQVGIEFDHAVMKNGSEMQMPMSIQAVIGQQNQAVQNGGGGSYGSQAGGSTSVPSGAGRSGGMGGGGSAPSAPASSVGSGSAPNDIPTNSQPQVTEKTSGVIGISDLKLDSATSTPNQGSVLTSEKNNVKLESGTLMLLRVNQ